VKVVRQSTGETITRTEQPRGEVFYHLKPRFQVSLQRFRVRTPTFANLPAMLKVLPDATLADVAELCAH